MNKRDEELMMEMYRKIPVNERLIWVITVKEYAETTPEDDNGIRQQLIAQHKGWA